MGPVRLAPFYDAGQVRARGENLSWKMPGTHLSYPGALIPDPGDFYQIPFNPFTSTFPPQINEIGDMSAFKTSTGAEIRFFMPVRRVSLDFCRQPLARRRAGQQPAAREEMEVPVRGGVNVLSGSAVGGLQLSATVGSLSRQSESGVNGLGQVPPAGGLIGLATNQLRAVT